MRRLASSRAALTAFIAATGLAPTTAQAACSAAQLYTLDWTARTSASLSTTTTTNFTVTNTAGGSKTVGVSFSGVTNAYVVYADTGGVSRQLPAIGSYSNGGLGGTPKTLTLGTDFAGYTTNIDSNTNVAAVTFTFSTPVTDIALKVFDVDYALGAYRDWVKIIGRNGALTYAPKMDTPYGNNNGTGARTAVGSYVNFGPTTVSGTTISASEGLGITGNAQLTEAGGNINVSFAQPVTSVELRYGNGPAASMTNVAGVQGIGIHNISFCPMPTLSATKTSAPDTGTFGAFHIPGNDVIYTLTVNNTGGGTIDFATDPLILTDLLPANVTFKNAPFDGTTTLPVKVVSAGGASIAAGDIAYKQTTGSTYTYTPAAGYDPAVGGIQITPTGTLAGNSTLSVQFKAQIK